jgi:alpha-tubulin suppressor-like RCC1 family protein
MSEIFNKSKIVKFSIICVLVSLLVLAGGCLFQSPQVNDSSHNGSPRFTAIASFGDSGLSLRADGRVVCWGHNYEGFCDGTQNLTNIKSISSMNYAVKNDGTIAAWGAPNLNPVVPPNLTVVIAITRTGTNNFALKDDGTVVAWRAFELPEMYRSEYNAQLAILANLSDITSISGNLGLKKDGTVVTWNIDENLQSSSLPDLSNVIAISNQGDNFAALRKDGTVVAWKIPYMGSQNAGKVIPIHIVENLTDIRAVSAGFSHSLALKRDGTVVSWTDDSLQSTDLTDIAAISAGSEFDLALKNNGTIVTWGGNNKFGQLFTPGKLNNVKSIASGSGNNIVLSKDGTITTWGNGFGGLCCLYGHEPEGIRNVTGILADDGYRNIILENNSTIYGWGEVEFGPYPVKRISHQYLTLFSGGNALFALKNGNLVVLSYNATNYNISQRLDNVTDVSSVYGQHTVALKRDGTVSVWGGDNLYKENEVPENLSGVVAVSTGLRHDLALKNDGTVVGWGVNAMGQTDAPKGLSDVTAIAAGVYQSLALKKDGTVVCWGGNKSGECNVPENLHDVTAIAAGFGQSLALKKDGTVVAWGQTVIPDWNGLGR